MTRVVKAVWGIIIMCLISVTDDDSKMKLKVPGGGVTITLTTPSDEQCPTNP